MSPRDAAAASNKSAIQRSSVSDHMFSARVGAISTNVLGRLAQHNHRLGTCWAIVGAALTTRLSVPDIDVSRSARSSGGRVFCRSGLLAIATVERHHGCSHNNLCAKVNQLIIIKLIIIKHLCSTINL